MKPVIDDFCANCKLYNWDQDREAVKRCRRCRVIAYCGMECQQEHWIKVHQKHCRYVGGTKRAQHSEHNKDTCNTCAMERSAGDLVLEKNNPNYICIFQHVNWNTLPPTFPHPFPLTSPPKDKIERILTVAQKLLLKIIETKDIAFCMGYEEMFKLEVNLWRLRSELYLDRIIGLDRNPKSALTLFRETFSDTFEALVKKTMKYIIKIDDFKPWATLALMINLMFDAAFLGLEKALKSPSSLPKGQRQMSNGEHFFAVVDKIIEALDEQVVPHKDIAAIVCEGNTDQVCNHCHKRITVAGAMVPMASKAVDDLSKNFCIVAKTADITTALLPPCPCPCPSSSSSSSTSPISSSSLSTPKVTSFIFPEYSNIAKLISFPRYFPLPSSPTNSHLNTLKLPGC